MFKALKKKVTKYYKYTTLNVTKVGSPTVTSNGIASGLANGVYIKSNTVINFNTANSWEIVLKLKTGSNIANVFMDFLGVTPVSIAVAIKYDGFFNLALGTGGSSWSIGNKAGTYSVQPNTNYFVRIRFTGSAYTLEYSLNGENYIKDIEIQSTTKIISGQVNIGTYAGNDRFLIGSIDLKECYIKQNGITYWTGMSYSPSNSSSYDFSRIEDGYFTYKKDNKYYA